jgi:hypothetical protein
MSPMPANMSEQEMIAQSMNFNLGQVHCGCDNVEEMLFNGLIDLDQALEFQEKIEKHAAKMKKNIKEIHVHKIGT